MNIPSLLVEYLITGGLACFWLLPLLIAQTKLSMEQLPDGVIAVLAVPLLYILGLGLDMLSGFVVTVLGSKDRIRSEVKLAFEKNHGRIDDDYLGLSDVLLQGVELGRELEKRSSRDRIARGAVLNCAVGAIVLLLLTANGFLPSYAWWLVAGVLAMGLFFWKVWGECEKRSYLFKLSAIHAVRRSQPTDGASAIADKSR